MSCLPLHPDRDDLLHDELNLVGVVSREIDAVNLSFFGLFLRLTGFLVALTEDLLLLQEQRFLCT